MKRLVFLVLVGTLVACSGSSPVSPPPAGKATCALCAFLGDDRYTAADAEGPSDEASPDNTQADSTAADSTPADSSLFSDSDLGDFLGDDRYTAADQLMAFAFAEEVEDLMYTICFWDEIYLVLPEAVGGEGAITYRVSGLPEGLSFDAATRTISGTPEEPTDGAVEVSYLAEDSAGASATLTFCITVYWAICDSWDFWDLFGVFGHLIGETVEQSRAKGQLPSVKVVNIFRRDSTFAALIDNPTSARPPTGWCQPLLSQWCPPSPRM